MTNLIKFVDQKPLTQQRIDAVLESKNKTAIRWLKRLQDTDTPWTEHNIIYFRKFIGAAGSKDPVLRNQLRSLFWDLMPDDGYKITAEQVDKGRVWLQNRAFKKNGQPRNYANYEFGHREQEVIKNLVDFTFSGLYQNNTAEWFLPVYTAKTENNSCFDYTVNGGLVEVLG